MFRIFFLLLVLCGITACATPTRLGISDAEWQNYSSDQQQKIKSGYYEMLKSRGKTDDEPIVSDGSALNVRICAGQVAMPPFTDLSNYSPVELSVISGNCQTVQINELNGNKKVPMKVCYLNKTLYIDPSRYDQTKKLGSIQLHYSPIWDRGFTYQNVSSSGYAHLTNANVTVRKYENNEPVDSAN
ncbi:MAG: hypothetical protein H0U71_09405 [Gammaproteobacteria bacterium]|nr:hypothetical protein [Gammaproteobacteria bacterium]